LKKFAVLYFILVTLSATVLKGIYNYDWDTVLYHYIVMSLIFLIQLFLNTILTLSFKKTSPTKFCFHTLNFLFLTGIIIFYLLVIGSNFFWKKTITLKIIKNYFFSINEFINVIPLQKWIVISFPLLIILITFLLYYIARPSLTALYTEVVKLKTKISFTILLLIIVISTLLFKNFLLEAKRKFHFAEEPFLIFTLGSMWQGNGEQMAFSRTRYENGLKDQHCLAEIEPLATRTPHSFIIILLDGLRSDHLSFYGYKRKTTPFLDSLYKTGSLSFVKNAFSPSNNTIGGIAGLFYSRDWDKFGYNGLNVPKFLRKAGYRNYAFLTGFHKEWYGLSALYRNDCDVYYESSMNLDERKRVDDDFRTLEVIKKAQLVENSFIYIHLLSVHHVGKKYDCFKKFLPDKIGFNGEKRNALINNYDNGILQSDFIIKEIFSKLEAEQILENATIFVTSDHGELFGEDNQWSHGGDLHEKVLEVPLLVYDKHRAIKNTEGATLLDIAPTIAERAGYNPPTCWQGTSLFVTPGNFTLNVYSDDEHSQFPYGLLQKSDSTYIFTTYDTRKKVQRIRQKVSGIWKAKD
jgi:glucan phosphoethanolaminetransferase (alkaline phosphatase superfamily)